MRPYGIIPIRKVPVIGPAWPIHPVSILRVVFPAFVAAFCCLGSFLLDPRFERGTASDALTQMSLACWSQMARSMV